MLPEEDRVSMSETQLKDHLVVLLAGRAAEKLIYDEPAVGAENDLERATSTARRMVTRWGMSDKLGPVSYKLSDEDPFLGREIHEQRQFSEHTMEVIDSEVSGFLHEAEKRADDLLVEYRDQLESLTQRLIETEELSECQIEDVIGPSVHPKALSDDNSPTEESTSDTPKVDSNVDAGSSIADDQPDPIATQQATEPDSDDLEPGF